MRKNADVAKILYEVADLLEIQDVQWKPQAYRKAAQAIENLQEDIETVIEEGRLEDLPGVGTHIAEKVKEIVKTGKLQYLNTLKKHVPIDVESLSSIEGLGPKTLKYLYKKLHVKNLADLKKAAMAGKIKALKGMGEKKEKMILEGVKLVQKRGPKRLLLGSITPLADEICSLLKKVDGVQQTTIAGSYRRGLAMIGDIDILLISSKPKKAMDAFVSIPDIEKVLAHGERRSSIRLRNGLQVDARALKKEQYGSALLYFTGSKEHNVAVRKRALKKGLTLSEYGLFTVRGKKLVASTTEDAVYKRLGMQYIPPEMREDRGEIELALKKKIPALISWKDIRGDFQTQTKWSDGADSIEEMAAYAERLGWKFLVITDHVGGIGIARPLDEKRLAKQAKEIDAINKKSSVHIFKGAEIDIKKNGELALSKKACGALDVVLASV
ncbi:MAG TPA: helix-hairpin-helix domain-containing protein, partial [Candidatus Nanoarchaeia archaeon]|nr:helix-hairpin-helix domain-containing protein [Candidatus Nanoarchaeia archaeon]